MYLDLRNWHCCQEMRLSRKFKFCLGSEAAADCGEDSCSEGQAVDFSVLDKTVM